MSRRPVPSAHLRAAPPAASCPRAQPFRLAGPANGESVQPPPNRSAGPTPSAHRTVTRKDAGNFAARLGTVGTLVRSGCVPSRNTVGHHSSKLTRLVEIRITNTAVTAGQELKIHPHHVPPAMCAAADARPPRQADRSEAQHVIILVTDARFADAEKGAADGRALTARLRIRGHPGTTALLAHSKRPRRNSARPTNRPGDPGA
jgi:hypothetical protein